MKCLLGRQPQCLTDLELVSAIALCDEAGGIEGVSRRVHRLRESMVQAVISQHLDRTLTSKTRPAAVVQDLNLGDSVDYFQGPLSEDASWWHGPVKVVNVDDLNRGMISNEWRAMTLQCQLQDIS